jgi:hypothetical protein
VSSSGTDLVVKWSVTPNASFTGAKNLWLYSGDASGAIDDWDDLGDWTINHAPQNVSVSPSSGTSNPGTARLFTATYRDLDGAATLRQVYLLTAPTVNGASGLYCYYDVTANKIYLRDDANKTWLGGVTPGVAGSAALTNSKGSLNVAQTTVSSSGTDLVVKWSVTPNASFTGAKNLWLYSGDASGAIDDWDDLGDWTISASAPISSASALPNQSAISSANAF